MPRSRSRSAASACGGLGLEAGDLVLLVGDERAEALELGLVAAGLGGADLAAGGVALGERGLGGDDAGAAGLVEGEDLARRAGGEAAAGEGGVEGVGLRRGSGGCRAFRPRKRARRVMADKRRKGKGFRRLETVWNGRYVLPQSGTLSARSLSMAALARKAACSAGASSGRRSARTPARPRTRGTERATSVTIRARMGGEAAGRTCTRLRRCRDRRGGGVRSAWIPRPGTSP